MSIYSACLAIASDKAHADLIQEDVSMADSNTYFDDSETMSVTSSIYKAHVENGRRYQTKREGEYWGPSDEKQVDSQHS